MQQHELHARVVHLLQSATAERDLSQRLTVLQQAADLLLHADTLPETVGSCLEYFINLQTDPHTSLRRYAAHFLGRALVYKPSLALRCAAPIAVLLLDGDGVVRELAAKAAIALRGRALFLLSLEGEALAFQRHSEQLQRVQETMMGLLRSGSPEQPLLFQLAARWAKSVVLAQTPSPLLVAARVPAELRGVSCLQDFPEKVSPLMDLNALRQQAEDLLGRLCGLLERPPQGRWLRWQLQALLQCVGAIARQRPVFFDSILACWGRLVQGAAAAEGPDGSVANAEASEVRRLICAEAQRLLASSLAEERHGEVAELLRLAGQGGTLEDLLAQAKYQQVCGLLEREAAERAAAEPKAKRMRRDWKRVWSAPAGAETALADEDAFDGDALLAGEAEYACRRFEEYFGLPSQREPAGHVPGPALLASRAAGHAELARIALTSLNSLAVKRSSLRDRAHERVVALSDAPLRGPGGAVGKGGSNGMVHDGAKELALFLTAEPSAPEGPDAAEREATRDPRRPLGRLARSASALAEDGNAEGALAEGEQLMPAEGVAAMLPTDAASREALELRLFEEVLAAHRRMERSPFAASLSAKQAAAFEQVSRQVALHLAAGSKAALSPTLQRNMCKAFMADAFETLKAAVAAASAAAAGAGGAGGKAAGAQGAAEPSAAGSEATTKALGKLVELFYAKFTTDVARWQDLHGQSAKPASEAAAKTPLREVLEGPRGERQHRVQFTYAELFEMFVAEFERLQLPKRELRAFLNDIPYVPQSAFKLLSAQSRAAGTRKMALLTVLSLIESKPASRWSGLRLLFTLAYSGGEDSTIRFDTIRLIVNKIYSPGPHPPMRWQLPHLTSEEALPLLGDGGEEAGGGWELAEDDFLPLQKLKGRCVEDVATLLLRSMAPKAAQFAFPIKVPLRIEQMLIELFKGSVCAPKDRVWLYLALCIKRPVLLHGLVETFTKCDADMKEHLVNSIEEALKYIPASEKELLVLVQKASPETERLVIKVLHILMQTSQGKSEGLSKEFGDAVTRLYGLTQNPKLLVPVFDLLERKSLLDFLPAVMQLEVEEVTAAFQQLVRSRAPPLSISELLTELHHMNNPTENIVPVKFSMQALNVLFAMRDQFDAKVYGIVVQALVEEAGPLPTLFMRTVIQVVKEIPRLCDFIVMQILPRLVRQEVWGDENMWRGFMIVLQHTFASQSGGAARVLAMLPMSQLEDVLVQHPDWKAQLREYVARQPIGAVAPHVRQLLQ